MADEELKEEKTSEEDATLETKTDAPDFDKEFVEAVEKFEKAEANREGFQKRKEKEKQTVDQVDLDVAKMEEDEAKVNDLVAKAISRQLPKLQASLAEDTVQGNAEQLSNGDSALKKLILFHFENSVRPNGTIRERMENALLIAQKPRILKTQKEMAVALKNRQGLQSSGLGVSTEGQEVKDNFFTPEQLASLKARGFDDKKIERLKANLRR